MDSMGPKNDSNTYDLPNMAWSIHYRSSSFLYKTSNRNAHSQFHPNPHNKYRCL